MDFVSEKIDMDALNEANSSKVKQKDHSEDVFFEVEDSFCAVYLIFCKYYNLLKDMKRSL